MIKKRRLIYCLLCLCLFSVVNSYAQKDYAEKYRSLRKTACTDTACADSLFLWLYFLHSDDVLVTDSLSEDFLQYAYSQTGDYLKANANLIKAVIRNKQGESIDAISFALAAIKYFHNQSNINVCFAYQNLARAYNTAGNYKLARESNKKALMIAEALQNDVLITNSYNSIGISYNHDEQYENAIPWFRRVVALSEKNKEMLAAGYENLGLCYRELGKYDSALFYSKEALTIIEQENDRYTIAYAFSDIGATYLMKKEYDTAIAYLQKAVQIREEQQDGFELAFTYMFLGDSYSGKNEKQKALHYYRKAIALNIKNNNLKQRYEIYHQLGELFYKFRDFDSAYIYSKKHAELRDSVMRAKSELSASATVASYELDEKEKNIQLLQQQNELKQLQIEARNGTLTIIAVVFLLLLVLASWLYNRINLKKKQQELLMLQNLQNDKERIARDLHDNVGGQLSYIIYSLDGIIDEDKEKRSEVTESIHQSVRSIINSLRETIWAISDTNINAQDFSDKLKVFARTLFRHSNTQIHFTENITSERELNALSGLNLYRICQEILNNAFKYALASQVNIEVQCDAEKLQITIQDNGIGFDFLQQNKEHYGLQNIRKRSEDFGITLTLETEIDKGTTYRLLV